MPISSGALDWPISYYTKPTAVETISDGRTDIDPWSHEHAYHNWTWKTKRGKRRKRKNKDNPDEQRRHRRRCCCCVLWWLATLLLIVLTLVLFMVFWIRDRAHDLPPLNPDQLDTLPDCKGTWGDTYVYQIYHYNTTYSWYTCCYAPSKATIAQIPKNGTWPSGYVVNTCPAGHEHCETALPDSPVCVASGLSVSVSITICSVCALILTFL